VDAAEDAQYGDNLQSATPRKLARRAERRERLAAAAGRLAAEDTVRRDAQRAKQEAWDAAAAAGKRRGGRRLGDELRTKPQQHRAAGEHHRPGCAGDAQPEGLRLRLQRPACRHRAAGDCGRDAVPAPGRPHLAPPTAGQCRDQLAAAGIRPKLRTVLADSGYVTEENFARAGQDKLRLLAPLAKDPNTHRISNPAGRRNLAKLPATARADRRMRHHRGRADYKLRAQTVEPVSGQIKTCQKMTIMSRRGFDACHSEWLLAATVHNLRKLHAHRLSA
jgi:Transposase DDE domain